MKFETFDKLVEYVVTECIKSVMCQKSDEYARGGDKLYNFKRAAKVSGKTPLECLQGMKLKHDVSILDMLDDETVKGNRQYTREKWEEKIGDDINYLILMLALLYEKYGWEIPGTGTKSDLESRKRCCVCIHQDHPFSTPPCSGCYGTEDHLHWELKK